jgi:hypothetical protein
MDDDDKKDGGEKAAKPLSERERRDAEIEARAPEAFERIYRKQNHWADWMFLADGLMVERR